MNADAVNAISENDGLLLSTMHCLGSGLENWVLYDTFSVQCGGCWWPENSRQWPRMAVLGHGVEHMDKFACPDDIPNRHYP